MNTEEKKENTGIEENANPNDNENLASTNPSSEEASKKSEVDEENPENKIKNQIAELNDKILRLLAENQNLRKNHEKEKEDIIKYGSFNFASQILSLTDNLDRAFSIFKNNEKFKDKEFLEITSGIELIEKELQNTLEKNFITYIDCLNKKFDPNFHQAMLEIEDNKVEPGTIIQEIQSGFMFSDRLLRPSFVGVSKKKDEKNSEKEEKS